MKWRCKVCNYIHEGQEPPLECPVCHVGSYAFEQVSETKPSAKTPHEGIPRKLLDGILKQTITKEKETYNMYFNASKIVKDTSAIKLINRLAEEESQHVSWLEDLYISHFSDTEKKKIKDTGTNHALTDIAAKSTPAVFNESTTLQDVINIAKQREQWAYEFFTSMAKFVDHKEVKKLFNNLANEELQHKRDIEKHCSNIA